MSTFASTHRLSEHTHDGRLRTESCCDCGVMFAAPAALLDQRLRDHNSFYCPNGHGQSYTGKSDAEKLREEKERTARVRAQLDQVTASERAQRAAATRARNERDRIKGRVAHGVCPCCNRTFKQLGRHMKTKHPDFEAGASA